MELIFATHNNHKAEEIESILKAGGMDVQIHSLKNFGHEAELAEDGDTLEANALQKAEQVWQMFGRPCFADDTGLEVEALDGAPGGYSARYAGPECRAEDNVQKLLRELDGQTNRKARFRTVIALILEGSVHYFEGTVEGTIIEEARGIKGFGYDPIFLPLNHKKTFAEMLEVEKNRISHRYKATLEMSSFLEQLKR